MNKICRTCKQELPITSFSVLTRKRATVRYNCDCSVCRSLRRTEARRKSKALAVAYKGGVCNDCNSIVHQAAFQFHHIDPGTKASKEPNNFLNDSANGALSEAAKEELDKCVLLCANCHAIRHFND